LLFESVNVAGGGLALDKLLGISQTQPLADLVRFVLFSSSAFVFFFFFES